jgi:hypothetical protein
MNHDVLKVIKYPINRVTVVVFNVTLNNISAISWRQFYWQRKPEYPEKTNDLWQVTNTLSHNVVSSTPPLSGIRTHKVSGDEH